MILSRRSFMGTMAGLGLGLASGMLGCAAQEEGTGPASVEDVAVEEAEESSAADAAYTDPSPIGPVFDLDSHTVTLNNGIQMPVLGIGTYILSSAQAEESVYAALMAGTRLIDTARIYGNEEGVGRGIARGGVPREEVFLTTKLWTADFADAAAAIFS